MSGNPKHNHLLSRLKRIEGQVRGVGRMVEDQRYCIDIMQQLTAARRAIDQVALNLLKGHVNHCVAHAIGQKDGQKKIDELMETFRRYI